MKLPTRILWFIALVVGIGATAIFVQRRLVDRPPLTHLSAADLETLLEGMPESRRAFFSTPEGRRQLADQIRQALAMAQEARRLGLLGRTEIAAQVEIQKISILASAYRDRHPDAEVSEEEIERFFRTNPMALDYVLAANPQLSRGALNEQVRHQYGELVLLAERARKEGLDRDPRIALQLRIFPEFILQSYLLRELQQRTVVSDDEIRRYYEAHKNEFEQVRARHILFSTRPIPRDGNPPPDRETVRRKAQEVLRRVRAGEDFATLAREFSDDPGSKDKGGDLDFFGRGRMVREFEEAAFALQPGQISDLVETSYGFHIIKVEARRIAPLDEETRLQIEQTLRQKKIQERINRILTRYPIVVEGASAKTSEP
ncbi:MAG: peptidylprolyl isomerase [Acidobacteriota bacterium]|nr:peptidylprolyl isomerase [Acidobacteriota bacterium]